MEPEKTFKKYVAATSKRNWFIAFVVLTVATIFLPPVAIAFAFLAVIIGIFRLTSAGSLKKRLRQ